MSAECAEYRRKRTPVHYHCSLRSATSRRPSDLSGSLANRYLRVLFVQAAWVVLIRPKSWQRYGLKPWIEAAKRRLHHNVLAIALANKLARIAWSVLSHDRSFEARCIH